MKTYASLRLLISSRDARERVTLYMKGTLSSEDTLTDTLIRLFDTMSLSSIYFSR